MPCFMLMECEEKLFVKSAYLTAMSQLDYRTYLKLLSGSWMEESDADGDDAGESEASE